MNLLALAVGLGLATSLLMSEVLGLASGGLVVPGYFALLLDRPVTLACIFVASLLTWAIVESLARVTILFGRRRTTLTLLLGYIVHLGLRAAAFQLPQLAGSYDAPAAEAVGLIVPGLLALWLSRQGALETLCALSCATAIVRLMLIVLLGDGVSA